MRIFKIIFISYMLTINVLYAEYITGIKGGQCVTYARNQTDQTPKKVHTPSLTGNHGAYHIYDEWDFGYGKGDVPEVNSLMVVNKTSSNEYGHVGIARKVTQDSKNPNIYYLRVDESNWYLDEKIVTNVYYEYNKQNKSVKREYIRYVYYDKNNTKQYDKTLVGKKLDQNNLKLGNTSYPVRGFVYTQDPDPLDTSNGINYTFIIIEKMPMDNKNVASIIKKHNLTSFYNYKITLHDFLIVINDYFFPSINFNSKIKISYNDIVNILGRKIPTNSNIDRKDFAKIFVNHYNLASSEYINHIQKVINNIREKNKKHNKKIEATLQKMKNPTDSKHWEYNWIVNDTWTTYGAILKVGNIWNGYKGNMLMDSKITMYQLLAILNNFKKYLNKHKISGGK